MELTKAIEQGDFKPIEKQDKDGNIKYALTDGSRELPLNKKQYESLIEAQCKDNG